MKNKEQKINEREVKHHNSIAYGKLEEFELRELKLFFCLMSEVESEQLIYNYDSKKIKKFINMGDQSYKAFEKIIGNLQKRRILIKIDENKYITYSIFSTLFFDKKDKKIVVKYNSDFLPLISDFKSNFCKYKLKNIELLSSKYSIIIYILSKANLFKRKYSLTISELLDKIGKNIRTDNLDKVVINPALEEINKFTDLNISIEKVYQSQQRGRSKLIGYTFYVSKKVLPLSLELKLAIEKAKKNIYISKSKVLNKQTIQILLDEFLEEELISGLEYAYIKVNKEFTTLEYLKKVILSKNEENRVQTIKIVEDENTDIIRKFYSLDEYDQLKIEEKALELLCSFEKVEMIDLLNIKEKNSNEYWKKLNNYIEQIMKQNISP